MHSNERVLEALSILELYNPLRNDLDAYLLEVIEWARGNRDKPNPNYYGLEEENA